MSVLRYDLVSQESWLCRLSASLLPTVSSLWYAASDGLWWSGKIRGRQATFVVRVLVDAGPSRPAFGSLFHGAGYGLYLIMMFGNTRLMPPWPIA